MGNQDSVICQGVPAFPSWAEPSKKYRDLFNAVAKELGFPIEYVHDAEGGLANIPEPSRGEIRVDPTASNFQVTEAILCQIRQVIEGRRRKVSEVAQEQMRVVPSATLGDDRMNMANPAEREWLRRTADGFQEASLDIFGRQSHPKYPLMEQWMREGHADHYSVYSYLRMRGLQPPNLEGGLRVEFASLTPFANLFPWFPEAPAYNGMLPRDLADAEKAYILKNYSKDDPIRLPWTVVERASEREGLRPVNWRDFLLS